MVCEQQVQRRKKQGVRRAFTAIEVMVVVSIIGVLIALLLPAVQHSRELARRTACVSKLSQTFLGVASYHESFEVYPAGTVGHFSPVVDFPGDYHHGWLLRIAPFIGYQTTIINIDSGLSIYDPKNRAASRTELEFLRCPSNPNYHQNWGVSSYAACYSGNIEPISDKSAGAFKLNVFAERHEFPDGLASTIFLGEKMAFQGNDLGWLSGTHATLRNTGVEINADTEDIYGNQIAPSGRAYGWYIADFAQDISDYETAFENETLPVASEDVTGYESTFRDWNVSGQQFSEAEFGQQAKPAESQKRLMVEMPVPVAPAVSKGVRKLTGFGSFHSGHGVNFVFGDGHVQFITSQVDRELYSQLGNKADGLPLQMPE